LAAAVSSRNCPAKRARRARDTKLWNTITLPENLFGRDSLTHAYCRIPGMNTTYASPVAAGGRVYLTDRSGTIVVIEDSDKFKVLATNSLGEGVDATPAIVGNEMFIRSAKHLFYIAE